MSTELGTRPAGSGTGTPVIVHLVCLTCYPDPKIGDKAICGHVGTRGVLPGEPNCLVCLDLVRKHDMDHFYRNES